MITLASQTVEENPDDAIAGLIDAQAMVDPSTDPLLMANIKGLLGVGHYYLSDNAAALKYWKQALVLAEIDGDLEFLAGLYNNLGNGYTDIDIDSGFYYYRKSISVYEALGMDAEKGDMLHNMSLSYYDDLGKYDSAYYYAWQALPMYASIPDSIGVASVWAQLGRVHAQTGQPDSAVYWSEKSLLASRYLNSTRVEEMALDALRFAYLAKGEVMMAYLYLDTLNQFHLELNEVERLAMVKELESRHRSDMQKLEIRGLEMEAANRVKEINRQKIVIGSSVIGLALLLFLGFKMMKEKRRSEDLLLNILPVKIAEELKSTGKAKARRYDSVSVIFTDFKDFSKLSDEIGPEELVEMIDEYYSAFDRIIETYGLEKIKTIGDSYMAAGGLPEPTNGHAEKAVQAALEMHTHMKILNAKKKKEGKRTFETRIGVHTGPVVAGVVGIKKFAYDIWGDTVNTANRLEKAGEPGKVNISANTYELVKHSFDCTHRGKIAIKNMGEIDMYFVG